MSVQETIDFQCPKCNTKSPLTVHRSINATSNPELRQALIEGKINFFSCSHCDQRGYVLVSLLYHDMERGFLVQYHPFPAVRSSEFLKQFDTHGRAKLDLAQLGGRLNRRLHYFTDIHIVFDMAELVRYIIFREKLYDLKQQPSQSK